MTQPSTTRLQDLTGLLHKLYPPFLAEEWDNVGLQVGDPGMPVERILVALDPTEATLAEALRRGAQALVCHHPLIFRPLKRLTPQDETGRILFRAVREGIAVLAAHTNLDRARDGLNDWLATRLGILDPQPLEAGAPGDLLKLVVFIPAGYEDRIAEALHRAGAGHIGSYDLCAFRVAGTGTFRPGAGSTPFIGRAGETEEVREIRLETILPRELTAKVLEKMRKSHPYEEVAFDLIPLANSRPGIGLGRIGRLATPLPLAQFADRVKEKLNAQSPRVVGDLATSIAKVAVCGGSGASLLHEAAHQGADVLVTGDVKYHEARNAESLGLALVDAGHFATEHLMVDALAERLKQAAREQRLELIIDTAEGEADPFQRV
ncbi:Nif3-like dinuclear metal center hexameric protein [Trichloromonas sp.]|uniref:Nif3-like dinuclear metal center hexameric protein n=1 Tax=Trichloromonas sp. TaxID=3069249 RepID=UPI002A41F7F4|nr:Nif3-like dinuclear metal center hexameric protein [Trichloromonas sp.]